MANLSFTGKKVSMNTQTEMDRLRCILEEMESILIAFSGGTDSAFLYKVAADVLGENVLGVTGRSASVPSHDRRDIEAFVARYRLPHLYIETGETGKEEYASNPANRCYFCKNELFSQLSKIQKERKIRWIADGSNADDGADYRPGTTAARQQGVRSPLQEAGLTKEAIRGLSREMGLPTWNKPSSACLASRFPYGTRITPEKMDRVDRCEEFLRALGIGQIRVRHIEPDARIEVLPEDLSRIIEHRAEIVSCFKNEGYRYIALDLEGFRSGSLNKMLPKQGSPKTEASATAPKPAPSERKKKFEFKPKTFGPGVFALYTDGGCQNNPGPGAWAFVLFDSEGKETARGSGKIDQTTNNIAEYRALIEGLQCAAKQGVKKLHVLSDSQLMVRQMDGSYRVKERSLQQLFLEALKARRAFEEFWIDHVPREENKLADLIVGQVLRPPAKKEDSPS